MGFSDAVKSCYQKNYLGFDGRASRSEYWYFVLSYFLLTAAVGGLSFLLGGRILLMVSLGLVMLAILLPSLAAQVRRLHDTNASGWWLLLAFIPYLGGVIMLVWFCIPGTSGWNRFGPDPLDPSNTQISP